MKHSLKTGFYFGLTSGVITTLGLIVGLHSGTHSKLVIMGGVITIAIADAFSDSLGIHMSEEAKDHNSVKSVWEATISTFFSKFFFALTFLVPLLVFELSTAIIVSIMWGLLLLSALSFSMAQHEKTKTWKVIAEHLIIAVFVIIVTHFVGDIVAAIA